MKKVSTNASNLITAMEANYIAYYTYFSGLPYLQLHRSPEITLITSKDIALWNVVIQARLAPQQVTATIESTLSTFKSLNQPLIWHVLPSTLPSNLEHSLKEYGFILFEEEPHMVIEPTAHTLHLPHIPGFTIERVTDTTSFARWYEATVAGFFPPHTLTRKNLLRRLYDARLRSTRSILALYRLYEWRTSYLFHFAFY